MPALALLTGQLDHDLRWKQQPDTDPQRTRRAFENSTYTVRVRAREHLEKLAQKGVCKKIQARLELLLSDQPIEVGLARDDRGRVPVNSIMRARLGSVFKDVQYPVACHITDPHTYGLIFEAHTEGGVQAPVPTPQVGDDDEEI